MARIYPFRGYRFDPALAGRVDDVVTQPYDKIPETLRKEYLGRSRFNIVRVIRNENYGEAAEFLNDWIQNGVLRRDLDPCLYVYEQVFSFEGETYSRVGIVGLVDLDDAELVVRGHERVLERPLSDRLNLIRKTRANEGLIFTLFSDASLKVDLVLEGYAEVHAPSVEVTDDFGVIHRVWAVSDPDVVAALRNLVDGLPLYIADGHHRFRTSQLFHKECLAEGFRPAALESFDKRMVALFNMESEGMRILPTHRGLKRLNDFRPHRFLLGLERHFRVKSATDFDDMYERVETGHHSLGFCWPEGHGLKAVVARLNEDALSDSEFMPDAEGPLRDLDVTILHSGVLAGLLGVGPDQVSSGEYVSYFRDKNELRLHLEQGSVQLGCFLRPTSLAQVRGVSEYGAKMPQKSTDFFPKLLTGLVLMKMEIDDSSEE